jgi:hypothetical protein
MATHEGLNILPEGIPANKRPFPLFDDGADFPLPPLPGMEAGGKKNKSAKRGAAEKFRKEHQGTARGPKHILKDNRGGHKPLR